MDGHKKERAARHIEEELRNAALNIAFEVRVMLDANEESVIDRVLDIIDDNKKCATDMNNDFDEGYYTACNHIEIAVKALKGEQG